MSIFRTSLVVACLFGCVGAIYSADPSDTGAVVFFDNEQIESMENLTRVVHQAQKYAGNPVLSPTEPWEMTTGTDELPGNAYANGTVLYDREEQIYKIWYQSWHVLEERNNKPVKYTYYIGYATSEDGIDWQKPNLGIYEFEGSTANNIVHGAPLHPASVIKYQPSGFRYVSSGAGTRLFSSEDGLHWKPLQARLPSVDGGPDSVSTSYDNSRRRFVSIFRGLKTVRGHRRRVQYLSTSTDFKQWSAAECVLEPDERDDEIAVSEGGDYAGIYRMPAIAYGSIYVGFPTLFIAGTGESYLQLAFSRDLRHWRRYDHGPALARGEPGRFDEAQIYGATFGSQVLVADGKIRFYYGGFNTAHSGVNRGAALGLATWRLDGFASLKNDSANTGIVTTVPLRVTGEHLKINADMDGGVLRAEVRDADGKTIEGFSKEASEPMQTDDLGFPLTWKENRDLSSLNGQTVKLSLYIENGHLYSIRSGVEPVN